MDIGAQKKGSWGRPLLLLTLLAAAFAAGLLWERGGGATAVATFWQQTRAQTGSGADLPRLTIDIPFENYNTLLAQREEALADGVFIAGEADFVNADVTLEGEQVPVRLRLQQGPAAHLGEDEKWNFDLRTRNDSLLRGMSRFYLIDPADNQWLREWAFMTALRREGLLAVRYDFVRLVVNGNDRGIYALQEGFAPSLPAANGRPPGIIVEFDAEPLWRAAQQFDGDLAAAADPVTNLRADQFQFYPLDIFQESTVAADPELAAQQAAAEALLRGLQSGELAAVDVFDPAAYGRFLALVDLFGATGTTALTNMRYYFDPTQAVLQPIGFNGHTATGRISPAMTYYDPLLQLAYAEALARYSDPAFLLELETALAEEWEQLQTALAGEITLAPPWEDLSSRQTLLQHSLDPAQPVLAYFDPVVPTRTDSVPIFIANPLNLPVEIVGIDVGGVAFVEAASEWLTDGEELLVDALPGVVLAGHAGGETAVLRYARFSLPLSTIVAEDAELNGRGVPEISVATRLPGSEQVVYTAVQSGPLPLLPGDNAEAADGAE